MQRIIAVGPAPLRRSNVKARRKARPISNSQASELERKLEATRLRLVSMITHGRRSTSIREGKAGRARNTRRRVRQRPWIDHAGEFFRWAEGQGADYFDFAFFKRNPRPASGFPNPYDLVISMAPKPALEHFTISSSGVTHFSSAQMELEFTEKAQWLRERSLFRQLIKLTVFSNFSRDNCFLIWRNAVAGKRYKKRKAFLAVNLVPLLGHRAWSEKAKSSRVMLVDTIVRHILQVAAAPVVASLYLHKLTYYIRRTKYTLRDLCRAAVAQCSCPHTRALHWALTSPLFPCSG